MIGRNLEILLFGVSISPMYGDECHGMNRAFGRSHIPFMGMIGQKKQRAVDLQLTSLSLG